MAKDKKKQKGPVKPVPDLPPWLKSPIPPPEVAGGSMIPGMFPHSIAGSPPPGVDWQSEPDYGRIPQAKQYPTAPPLSIQDVAALAGVPPGVANAAMPPNPFSGIIADGPWQQMGGGSRSPQQMPQQPPAQPQAKYGPNNVIPAEPAKAFPDLSIYGKNGGKTANPPIEPMPAEPAKAFPDLSIYGKNGGKTPNPPIEPMPAEEAEPPIEPMPAEEAEEEKENAKKGINAMIGSGSIDQNMGKLLLKNLDRYMGIEAQPNLDPVAGWLKRNYDIDTNLKPTFTPLQISALQDQATDGLRKYQENEARVRQAATAARERQKLENNKFAYKRDVYDPAFWADQAKRRANEAERTRKYDSRGGAAVLKPKDHWAATSNIEKSEPYERSSNLTSFIGTMNRLRGMVSKYGPTLTGVQASEMGSVWGMATPKFMKGFGLGVPTGKDMAIWEAVARNPSSLNTLIMSQFKGGKAGLLASIDAAVNEAQVSYDENIRMLRSRGKNNPTYEKPVNDMIGGLNENNKKAREDPQKAAKEAERQRILRRKERVDAERAALRKSINASKKKGGK